MDTIETVFGGVFLLLAVMLVSAEITVRTFFSTSIVGAEQIASFLIMWSLFFAASHAISRNRHVRVDILRNLLTARPRWAFEIVIALCMLIFTVYLTYSGYLLILESRMLGEETIGLVTIPFWIPQLVTMFGGAFMTVRVLQRLYRLISTGTDEYDDTDSAQSANI